MSLIPKIKLGQKTSKSNFHIPSLTHGTSEIGYVYPSYSRNLLNDVHIKIGARSSVRLSPLFVPTMGDLSLRHYFTFVPFNKIWTPFDAFLDKKPFAFADGHTAVPTSIPYFDIGFLMRLLMQENGNAFNKSNLDSLRDTLTMTIYVLPEDSSTSDVPHLATSAEIDELFGTRTSKQVGGVQYYHNAGLDDYFKTNHFAFSNGSYSYGGIPSVWFTPNQFTQDGYIEYYFKTNIGNDGIEFLYNQVVHQFTASSNSGNNRLSEYHSFINNLSIPSYDSCDFMDSKVIDGKNVYFCYNFNGAWKRLRSVMLGLGYCFNPFDEQPVTPLKLLAFYRSYWSLNGVNRQVNFQDTNCAKLGRFMSNLGSGSLSILSGSNASLRSLLITFLNDLTKCTYTCPSDYFSSSVLNTQNSLLDSGGTLQIRSEGGDVDSSENIVGFARASASANASAGTRVDSNYQVTGIGIQLALKMLRWINRNTVVGSKIYDSLRARFGDIEVNDETSEGVQRIGENSVQINIGAIFNQSDTNDGAPLGDFAGVGTGGTNGATERFDFNTPSYGCVICLTAVVPQMGYFQGMLRENSDGIGDSFEMFDPTYDAVGWQSLRYNELISDRQFNQDPNSTNQFLDEFLYGTGLGLFGYQPRYTHMKVSFNRCIGDISLPHMQDSMLPYTLDRFFPQRSQNMPANNPQWLRSGTRGELNRIFQVTSPTDDHVIWQLYFDVDMDAPMKSISESYDTRLPDDSGSIVVSHE